MTKRFLCLLEQKRNKKAESEKKAVDDRTGANILPVDFRIRDDRRTTWPDHRPAITWKHVGLSPRHEEPDRTKETRVTVGKKPLELEGFVIRWISHQRNIKTRLHPTNSIDSRNHVILDKAQRCTKEPSPKFDPTSESTLWSSTSLSQVCAINGLTNLGLSKGTRRENTWSETEEERDTLATAICFANNGHWHSMEDQSVGWNVANVSDQPRNPLNQGN